MDAVTRGLGDGRRYATMNEYSTWMFEVYYKSPSDAVREEKILQVVNAVGGRLDYREEPEVDSSANICLTYEFDDLGAATTASEQIRMLGEHVEGPSPYS